MSVPAAMLLILLALLLCSARASVAPELRPAGRMAGAVQLKRRGAPFAAMLSVGRRFCSGSVIAPRWVLLAAHCKLPPGTGIAHTADGARRVLRVIRHPGFRLFNATIRNDIALALLNASVGPVARPVRLNGDGDVPEAGETVFAFGFGARNEDKDDPRVLRRAGMTAMEVRSCRRMMQFPSWRRGVDDAMHVCVNEWLRGAGICAGDSGGPLLVRGVQIGVASYRLGPCGSRRRPDVFTRVQPYVPWIESQVGMKLV